MVRVPIRPLWPNPMRPKEAKGGSPLAPKARGVPNHKLGPPEPNLARNHHGTKMAINHHRTQFGAGSPWTTFSAHGPPFQPMAPGGHQRTPDQLSSILPLTLRGILSFLHAPHTQGCRSGPNYIFPNQGPKIQHPF
ncbi:hypothetical protein O181_130269 [Austropuccinia psidii MF-1]|uniref:Uncharacterized protein n=1 Tax=Austropuccinia psidii MF-1 TaxID=1389203 RepID=A0A9Q3Q9X6_9BASI|nr:hypothetical protein [Austropuccinia psidii MF-1]